MIGRTLRLMGQREWLVQVVLRATDDEVTQVVERLGEVICVPADHDGPCRTPWTLTRCPVDDLEEPERSAKRALLTEV
ncbi:MAG: hypothetical protein JWP14_2061 [Frankiales bacterium]|nr:hypothetical protein [Frankiales bacterium]